MGNSCNKGRANPGLDLKPNATISSPTEQKTSFKWTIDGFSSLLDKGQGWTYSSVFENMGVNWYLKLNPKDRKSNDEKEHVSLRLELSETSVEPDTVIEASFKFLIYDQYYGKHREQLVEHSFHTASTSSGIPCMIPLETLKTSGFVVNNSCTFGIKFIKVATVKANATLETLFVKKDVFNKVVAYTWVIEDFFALKNPSSSPEFEVGGYKWFIRMYPTTSDGNHLGLFLIMKKPNHLPKDYWKLIELSLSIKDQENGKDRKITGRYQTSNNAPGWGFDKFISMENFKDASKGYLIKGKCCIEAEVAIAGSSKTR